MLTEQLPNNNARLVSTSLHSHLLHSHHLEIPTALQPAASGDKLLSKYPQIQHAAIQAHLSHKATLYACCRFENQTLPISDWKKNPKCFDLKTLQRNKTESSEIQVLKLLTRPTRASKQSMHLIHECVMWSNICLCELISRDLFRSLHWKPGSLSTVICHRTRSPLVTFMLCATEQHCQSLYERDTAYESQEVKTVKINRKGS